MLAFSLRGMLASLWLLASERGNVLPYEPQLLGDELGSGEPVDLAAIADWIEVYDSYSKCASRSDSKKSTPRGQRTESSSSSSRLATNGQVDLILQMAGERGVEVDVTGLRMCDARGEIEKLKALPVKSKPDPAAVEKAVEREARVAYDVEVEMMGANARSFEHHLEEARRGYGLCDRN